MEQGSLHFYFTLGAANCVASPVVLRCCDTTHYSYLLSLNSPDKSCEVGMIILALLLWKLKLREVKLFAQSYTAGIWTLTTLSPKPTLFHLTCSQNILVLRHGFPPLFQPEPPTALWGQSHYSHRRKVTVSQQVSTRAGLEVRSFRPGLPETWVNRPCVQKNNSMETCEIQGCQKPPSLSTYLLISQWLMASIDHAQRWWMTQRMEVPWQHWVQTLPFIDGGTRGWEKGSNLP